MSRKPGDWDCAHCNHLNFSRRDSCQRCGEPRDRIIEFSNSGSRAASPSVPSYGFGAGPISSSRYVSEVRPGDWYCPDCNAHNFASRSGCYKCGSLRDDEPGDGGGGSSGGGGRSRFDYFQAAAPRRSAPLPPRSTWKSGDWICPRIGCEEHNFASRMECFRCSARRETTGM